MNFCEILNKYLFEKFEAPLAYSKALILSVIENSYQSIVIGFFFRFATVRYTLKYIVCMNEHTVISISFHDFSH